MLQNIIEINTPFIEYIPANDESDLLWIIVSHINIPEGKFGQSRIFSSLGGAKLYINCARNSWYQQGVGGGINSIATLVEALVRLCDKIPRVRVIGHSMGAYLALILQHVADIEYAITTSPEPILMVRNARSTTNDVKPDPAWINLLERFMKTSYLAPGFTFYGAYDPVDAYFLANIERHQALYRHVYAVPHHHGVTEYFTALRCYRDVVLRPFEMHRTLSKKGIVRMPSDYGTKRAYIDYYELHNCLGDNADESQLRELVQRRPGWQNPGYQYLRSIGYMRIGQYEEAAAVARAAIVHDLPYAEPAVAYARALSRIGSARERSEFAALLRQLPYGEGVVLKILEILRRDPSTAI